ncbi:MAG: acyltransferase [Bacteroides sp.]|nr:acyltransferase [Bacteroidales bacterium]MBD5301776.1 acyltransferase [Bacteroides sp.]MBD5305369.1 acyltransferase [Bacteroides sp.]
MVKIRNCVRLVAIFVRYLILTKIYGMEISRTARISFGAKLDKTNPKGIHIGKESFIASGAIILSHDFSRNIHADTYIGTQCFIGVNAVVMCGVRIGDNCVIGAGAIVTKDIPSNCMVVGNPARIIREGINTIKFGQLVNTK